MSPHHDAYGAAAEYESVTHRGITRRQMLGGSVVVGAAAIAGAIPFVRSRSADITRSAGLRQAPTADGTPAAGAPGEEAPGEATPEAHWQPGYFVMNVEVPSPMIAFTFDDGPSPDNTYAVLKELASRKIKATFFVVGAAVRAWPHIARDVVSDGHEIGNHSIDHTPYESAALASQIAGAQQIILDEVGVVPVVHRAPGFTRGFEILNECKANGLYECHTHMSVSDAEMPRPSAKELVAEFSRGHLNGAFPTYHDGGTTRPTPDAIGAILDVALEVGYQTMTATEMVNSGTPVPGGPSYIGFRQPNGAVVEDGVERVPVPSVCCDFDLRGSMVDRLEHPSVKRAERSRIVEQLAMLDDSRRSG